MVPYVTMEAIFHLLGLVIGACRFFSSVYIDLFLFFLSLLFFNAFPHVPSHADFLDKCGISNLA